MSLKVYGYVFVIGYNVANGLNDVLQKYLGNTN